MNGTVAGRVGWITVGWVVSETAGVKRGELIFILLHQW
jgi:hypothetical protein